MLISFSWALQGTQAAGSSPDTGQVANFWSALPTAMWIALILVLLVVFQSRVRDLLASLVWRVRCGTLLRLGSLEFGATYVSPKGDISRAAGHIESRSDKDDLRLNERNRYYGPNRRIFLVHKLAVSKEHGQLYDIELYLIPHKDATLACVSHTEYYFGYYWGKKIFISQDRARGFSISTSAYGPFVATAEIFFTDGSSAMVSRYVDFEMGSAGSQPLVSKSAAPAV